MIVMASQQQEAEAGDATNFVITFAGALLENGLALAKMGLTPGEIAIGYEMALNKAIEILEGLVCKTVTAFGDKADVVQNIQASIMSKQYGCEEFLSEIIAEACTLVYTEKSAFNVDNIRVCKILGSSMFDSKVMSGMVFANKESEGEVQGVEDAKVVIFACPFDIAQTETKGTVLIKSAEELMNYSKGEESSIECQVKVIAETGIKVLVSGGKIGEMALHFLNKYKIMAVRFQSKFDVRRLCKALGAYPLNSIRIPKEQELGHVACARVSEIGDTSVVIFERKDSSIATIVIRGSTGNRMDDLERAVDDGINNFKLLTRDARLLPGAGATEIELAKEITASADSCAGLEQYSIKKFAESLQIIPRTISENSGLKTRELLVKLLAEHEAGKKNVGVDVDSTAEPRTIDAVEKGIFDSYLAKHWALKFATAAACTVLKVDKIIMAKPAGGPKPRENKNWDDD